MNTIVQAGHDFTRNALMVYQPEVIVGRWLRRPKWFTNDKLVQGKEFKRENFIRERDDFEIDLHVMNNVGGLPIMTFNEAGKIYSLVLNLGDEPRLHYIHRWISFLGDKTYRDHCMKEIPDDIKGWPRYRDMEDKIASAKFIWDMLAVFEKQVLIGDGPMIGSSLATDYAVAINEAFPGKKLETLLSVASYYLGWAYEGRQHDPDCPHICPNSVKMLIDFWPLAQVQYPGYEGFSRGSTFYFPEAFVQKYGDPILTVEKAEPRRFLEAAAPEV